MSIWRHLDTKMIKLRLETRPTPLDDGDERTARMVMDDKHRMIEELVGLLEQSEKVGNPKKLLLDFFNREKRHTTAIGHGVAVPHVRTMQAKEFLIAIGVSPEGFDFEAPDGEPVQLFFAMAAPPYDETTYLRVFKELSALLQHDYFRERLVNAEREYDIIRAFKEME